MKKIITSILLTVGFLTITAGAVHAQSFSYQIPNPSRYDSLEEFISALTTLIQPIFVLTFAGFVLYGSWVRLTSQGDPEKIASSQKIIVAAATGFAIAVLAPSVVNVVTSLLGVEGLETIT